MQTIAITDRRCCGLIEKPMPRIREGYSLIKVHAAPMCNEHHAYANLDFRDRNRSDSLGHEATGEVVETGAASRLRPGARVVALNGYPCGRCTLCRRGYYGHCPRPVDPLAECQSPSGDCGFAQYMIKPDWMLLPIPDDLSYDHASLAGCGLGATFTAMENMGVGPADTVLVTGLGPVGLGAVVNGVLRGARVLGAGRHPYRSAMAQKLGAATVVDPTDPDALPTLWRLTDGQGVDCAIECSAAPMYQRLALNAVRRRGRVSFLAESGELAIHIDRDIIQKGLTLFGSLELYLHHAPALLRLLARASPLIDSLITHRLPLSSIKDAWELQLAGGCGKIVLHPWS